MDLKFREHAASGGKWGFGLSDLIFKGSNPT